MAGTYLEEVNQKLWPIPHWEAVGLPRELYVLLVLFVIVMNDSVLLLWQQPLSTAVSELKAQQ